MKDAVNLEVRLAKTQEDLKGAARLRYHVFVVELGADGEGVDHDRRFELDSFDAHADQLVLVDVDKDAATFDHVVGVYRLMQSKTALQAGGFYSETEYDLTPIKSSGRTLLELGRSCLHPAHRGGVGMMYLWQGLAEYVQQHEIEVLFGVASFHGTDVDKVAQSLSHLHHAHLAPQELRPRSVRHQSMDLIAPDLIDRPAAMKATPSLIKAYLRLGGKVGDGAFIDHDFNTIDVCLVMDTAQMSAKHRKIYADGRQI